MVIFNENEVLINDVRYPLKDKIRPVWASVFPEKTVLGDFGKDTDPNISTWAKTTHERGNLIEELEEQRPEHKYRCWWSTADVRFAGNMTLLPLATTISNDYIGLDITNPDMELNSNWTSVVSGEASRSNIQAYEGTYSWLVRSGYIYQTLTTWSNDFQSKKVKLWCWVWAAAVSSGRIAVYDGQSVAYSSYHTGGSTWELLSVDTTLAADATELTVRLYEDAGQALHAYFDNVAITKHGKLDVAENFNGDMYFSIDNTLYKIADSDGSLSLIRAFVGDIKALVASVDSNLYIMLGDSYDYQYMSTAEVIADTDIDDATFAIHWDSKLFKIDSAGATSYSADPDTASPSWTANGDLADAGVADGEINSLFLYRDASGTVIIYAATTQGLYAHDFANAAWLKTELELPDMTNAGKGAVHWRNASYTSAGLHVHKYVAASTAVIENVGLANDDSMPESRGGEIVKFIKGHNEFFALVDSTYEGSSSRSTIMAYNEKGWHCWWEAGSDNMSFSGGIVSSVFDYRLWFGAGSDTYWIPLREIDLKPKKISGYTYATSGTFYSPWFDAGWANIDKLAFKLKIKTSGCSANETVIVSYRTNHTNTNLSTGWTTASTITSDTVTTYTFGSSAGITFKSIQFKIAFARGGTNTNSPNVEWFSLEHLLNIPTRWGYRFTVDCSKEYQKNTPEQLLSALRTAIETGTLVTFSFDDTNTYHGRIWSAQAIQQTGDNQWGEYEIYFLVP